MSDSSTPDERVIAARLAARYDPRIASTEFLPIGDGASAAVCEVVASDGTSDFLKIRSGSTMGQACWCRGR